MSDEGVENLNKAFQDLVGLKTSGLGDLSYSSDDNDDDYFQEIEDEAHFIKYSGARKVNYGWQQTNIIPGGPKPPNYSGMSKAKLEEAKKEYIWEQKRYTNRLRMKRFNQQNDMFKPDSFTRCLSLVLQPMLDVLAFWLDVNQHFPDKELLTMGVAEEANLRGINFVCSFVSLPISPSVEDGMSPLCAFVKEMTLLTLTKTPCKYPPRSQHCHLGQSG